MFRNKHSAASPDAKWLWLWTRLQSSENTTLFLLALGVGLTTGVGVWLFRLGIELSHHLFTDLLGGELLSPFIGSAAILLTLPLAGLLVGWIMDRFIGDERHHGVAGIIESVALAGGRLRYMRIPFKAVASALSLGASASVGPEDPSVQIGANLGSFFGQRLRLSEDRVRLLVAAGGASAIAAAFRAPIAGVFFALEVILNGEFNTGAFGVVVLSAVVSSVFTQAVEAAGPEFGLLHYTLGGPLEVPFYVLLGLLLAPIAVLFIRAVYWQHDLWHRYARRLPRPLKTAFAGAIVAAVGIFLPQILGTGREAMTAVLNNGDAEFAVLLLLMLGVVKLFMTTISLAGGFVGGMFAPSLFVGTMLGGAFGRIVTSIAPQSLVGDPQAYAIAGMAAVMAGVVRAPITAILLVFELTNDYMLILPIMLTTVVCVYVAERLEPSGVYILGLLRKGIRIQNTRDFDVMQTLTVAEAMIMPAPSIGEHASLVQLRDVLRETGLRSLCVLDDAGQLVGIVTYKDLQAAYVQGQEGLSVGDICTRNVVTTTPDVTLGTAIRSMAASDLGRLPVLKQGTRIPVGMLSRVDIVRAYNIAISRKIEEHHTVEQVRLHAFTGAHVIDFVVAPNAPIAGKQICDVQWPQESAVASIRRGERLLVPHGSTILKAGDTMTIVTEPECEQKLARLAGRSQNLMHPT